MKDKFKLCIKLDTGEYLRYGAGDKSYIAHLIYDYLVRNNMYDRDKIEFKIERL